MSNRFCPFPKDFLWGVATAAYQIEGAAREDGRTPSVWDTFTHHRAGAIAMDHNGDVATDHYHRSKQDVALMKAMGLKAYRFSVSWSRIFPDHTAKPNPKGLDFYQRLIDELRAASIEPWMTLFHWDLPQWAEDRFRGWESKECADAFAEYAGFMAKKLGDRVAGFMTINEFMCFLDKAYTPSTEQFAPGKIVPRKIFNQARHHAVYGHGLAVQAIRASAPRSVRIGLAENIPNIVPILETPEHIAAARDALRELSGMYLTPILEGAYHPAYLEAQGADAPHFTDAEMKTIHSPLDFVGLNLYAPTYIRHAAASDPDPAPASNPAPAPAPASASAYADPASDPSPATADTRPQRGRTWAIVRNDAHYPRMDMPWLYIGPSILYWGPRLVSEIWPNVPAIYITENGCANPDRPNAAGEILDTARVMYLQQHLIHAHRATAEGFNLKGYFLWSLLDNFEWAFGYTKRFGIHYVNFQTQQRTPKLSAQYYTHIIRHNALGVVGGGGDE